MNTVEKKLLSVLFYGLDIFHERAFGTELTQSEGLNVIVNKFLCFADDNTFMTTDSIVQAAWKFATNVKHSNHNCDSDVLMSSIFNTLKGGSFTNTYQCKKLSIKEETVIPSPFVKNNKDCYRKLWQEFVAEYEKLPVGTFRAFYESALFLMKKYCWSMPVSNNLKEVSLYEALKVSAAIAFCLASKHQEVAPCLFIGGDLSGIQKFIYNITSKKASVSLKGRSFYLQLMVDAALQRIISHKDIQATTAQVVYSSGGKFYIVLPNNADVKRSLDSLKQEFQQFLWNEMNGQLQMNVSYIPFSLEANVGNLWKQLSDKLTEEKNKRFYDIMDYSLFEPKEASHMQVCDITGVESEHLVSVEEDCRVLPIVMKQIELGTVLKDADYIITHSRSADFKCTGAKCDVEIFGVHNYLFDKSELNSAMADFRNIKTEDSICVKKINSLDFLELLKGESVSYGFQFYGGNQQAAGVKGQNKTFEELACGQYLGVLRMDVDNLGSLFIKGIPDGLRTFAGYSTLSFMLDYFFSGYLNTIRDKYANDVNILYSGGDDVFAIGRWDCVIHFAESIRNEFARFVGRNDISISGGIVLVGDSFPISKSAEIAGEEEENAKRANDGKKNALALFGEVISWDGDFTTIKQRKCQFVELCVKERMPRSILHRIMALYEKVKQGDDSWLWHWAYYIARFVEGKSQNVEDYCKRLKIELCNKEAFRLSAIAARWAELELRFINIKKNNL